jgi:DNA (cytosine-5)-methyltransferase 1
VPGCLRRLTVQEAAALQTFRQGWVFEGSQSARFRQIGNAVPPRLAYAVAMELGRQLNERAEAEARSAPAQVAAAARCRATET